jgi:hypothetical protein
LKKEESNNKRKVMKNYDKNKRKAIIIRCKPIAGGR